MWKKLSKSRARATSFEFVVPSGLPEHGTESAVSLDNVTDWHVCHLALVEQLGEGVPVVPRVP